jgi:replicative DNA helicase
LVEEIKEFATSYKVPKEEIDDILSEIADLYRVNLLDRDAISERVIRFGKRQAMRVAIIEATDLIEDDDEFDKVTRLISDAAAVGSNANQLGTQLFGSFYDLPSMARESVYNRGKIPTNFPMFDRGLRGGPGRGEVWIVMGMPGIGKSQLLTNFGAVCIATEALPVVHITIGDLDELDVSARYGARLSLLSIDDVTDGSEEYLRKAAKLDRLLERYLRIKYYSSYSINPIGVRAYLERLIAVDGVRPAMLIVDYPDEFRPYNHDNMYLNMGRVYSELGAIAADFDVLVWVASQVRRWRPDKDTDVITMDNIADSWLKAAKADGIVSFNQTNEEHINSRARMWVDKVRRGRSKYVVPLFTDLGACYVRQLTAEEIEQERDEEED